MEAAQLLLCISLFKQLLDAIMKIFMLLAASMLLMACQVQPKIVPVSATFDADETKHRLGEGENAILGNALLRQQGGGVVTCAGAKVELRPATDYATERIRYIYNSTTSGYVPSIMAQNISFSPDEPLYYQLVKETVCDAQGDFEFEKVADGDFYINTFVVWVAGQFNVQQGGVLMQRVSVSGGETKKVVLTQ